MFGDFFGRPRRLCFWQLIMRRLVGYYFCFQFLKVLVHLVVFEVVEERAE